MRVGAAVMPPGQPAVADAGSGTSKCRVQNVLPVSLSIANTLFELPMTVESGVNSVTPLTVTPCDSEFNCRGWFSSLVFH